MVWKQILPCVNCDLDLGDNTLSQCHDTIVWYIFKIQHGCEELLPWHGCRYVCTLALTLEIWPWVKVMTHPWVMDNNCVKYYPDPIWQWGVMARTWILGMCVLWPWNKIYNLGSRSWHTLGSWTIIVWNIIQIQFGSEELWSGHRFSVYVHCDFDLGNMTWVNVMTHPWFMDNNCVKYYPNWQWGVMAQTRIFGMCSLWHWPWRYDLGLGHDTPLGHGQQLCEILSTSNLAVRSYGPDTDLGMCALWPWNKRYNLGSRSWHTLVSWTIMVWNIIQIQFGSEELWSGHRFSVYVTGWTTTFKPTPLSHF